MTTRIHCTVLDKKRIHMDGDLLYIHRPDGDIEEFNIDTEAMIELVGQMTSIICKRSLDYVKHLESMTEYIRSEIDKEEKE